MELTLETVRAAFGWATVMNWAIFFFWFAIYANAKEWIQKYHGKWFELTPQQFDQIHYAGMAMFKLGILLFNLVPSLALRIVG